VTNKDIRHQVFRRRGSAGAIVTVVTCTAAESGLGGIVTTTIIADTIVVDRAPL
jgi:hypothetical protein